jgi:hypothetical protein
MKLNHSTTNDAIAKKLDRIIAIMEANLTPQDEVANKVEAWREWREWLKKADLRMSSTFKTGQQGQEGQEGQEGQ